jgi:hypothetical protein
MQLPDGSMFCQQCGKRLINDNDADPSAPQQASQTVSEQPEFTAEQSQSAPQSARPATSQIESVLNTIFSNLVFPWTKVQIPPLPETWQDTGSTDILASTSDYYITQFNTYAHDGTSKINWASFFLGLFHAAYRSMWVEILQYLAAPYIATIVMALLATATLRSFSFGLMTLFSFLEVVCGIWALVSQIQFAARFNRLYAIHVWGKIQCKDYSPDTSTQNVLVVAGVMVVLLILQIIV